jgi:hypothetical protein
MIGQTQSALLKRRCLQTLEFLATLLLFYSFSIPIEAQRREALTDAQVERAAELAARTIAPSNEQLQIDRRKDLEDLLSNIEERKPAKNVYFYETRRAPRPAPDAASFWVIAKSAVLCRKTYNFLLSMF